MNGPEHYAEAERVRQAIRTPHDAAMNGFDGWQRDDLIAFATLHATLALAAASQPTHVVVHNNAPVDVDLVRRFTR